MTTARIARTASRRTVGALAVAVPVLAVIGLAGCGDDDDALGTNVQILPTSFQTRPVATAAPDPDAPITTNEEGRVSGSQTYTVRRGDHLAAIAQRFGIEIADICAVNGWDPCLTHAIHPQDQITIPPNALDGERDPDEDEPDDDLSDILEVDPEECPDGSQRPTYEIEQGDFQGSVARKLDIPLEQLAEVNDAVGNSQAWNSFPIGHDLYLPCDDEFDDDDD